MPQIDDWADVLAPEIRSVWPLVASAVNRIKGSLVGGTALAIHLRHRESYDLDYMTTVAFSGQKLYREIESMATSCQMNSAETDQMTAVVNGVAVDIFRAPHRGLIPGHVKQLQRPQRIDGMRVASLPDLLATKLDVIMYRPKLRDYIDIVAIDKSGMLRIEDGLRLHMERYGTGPQTRVLDHLVDLLQNPGNLATDRTFADQQSETLAYLTARVPELRLHLARIRQATASATAAVPKARPSAPKHPEHGEAPSSPNTPELPT